MAAAASNHLGLRPRSHASTTNTATTATTDDATAEGNPARGCPLTLFAPSSRMASARASAKESAGGATVRRRVL